MLPFDFSTPISTLFLPSKAAARLLKSFLHPPVLTEAYGAHLSARGGAAGGGGVPLSGPDSEEAEKLLMADLRSRMDDEQVREGKRPPASMLGMHAFG